MTASRRLRVVIVDDERDTVATLREILALEGHEVVGADSAPEAIRQIRRQPPDAVLVDINMPGTSGYEVAREVRRLYGAVAPRLLAISGTCTGQTDRMLSKLAGFDHFLEKPCDPQLVIALLALLRSQAPTPAVSLTEDTVVPEERDSSSAA